ncbi:MAG: hypothetical protein HN368_15950, partial [Spirochaetales bacterium]|nr:hypothetical protein [Spirochaetales bacterium]
AGNNIQISLTAEDFAAAATPVQITVDVVPYISRLDSYLTAAFSSAFNRSALGTYPVLVDSVNAAYETINVVGYNLNPVGTGADSDARISKDTDGIDLAVKKGTGLPWSNVAADFTSLDVELNTDGSGYLNILVNGIPTINNINDDSSNAEGDFINPNLRDNRYLAVWDINKLRQTVATANNAVYPSMALNGDTPVFAYVNNAAGYGRARYWDGAVEKQIYDNWDLFTYSAIDINSNGNHGVLFDINVVNGNYGDYNSGNYGGILTSFYYDVPAHTWYPGSRYFQDNHIWLDNLVDASATTTAVLDRYQYPDLHFNSAGTTAESYVFYTVYDRMEDEIRFRFYRVGTTAGIAATTGGQINNAGTALYTDLEQYNRTDIFPAYDGNNDDNARFISSNTTGKNPAGVHTIETVNTGEFSAVASTADASAALVVWQDASGTGNLRLKYNYSVAVPRSFAPGGWLTMGGSEIIASNLGGEYVDMAIDGSDNIHIAYYDNNNGDLRYIYIPVTDFSTGSFGTVTDVRVDSYFDVGEKLHIEVSGAGVPYIAYKGINRTGRVAWLAGSLGDGTNASDEFTGTWEIQTLPTEIDSSDSNRFSIGIDTNDLPVAGYTNGGLEYIRLLPELAD